MFTTHKNIYIVTVHYILGKWAINKQYNENDEFVEYMHVKGYGY